MATSGRPYPDPIDSGKNITEALQRSLVNYF